MNRKIIFRGKTIKTGRWVFGNIQVPDAPFNEFLMMDEKHWQVQVKKETIEQYVGLNDKNGRSIYEGDIIAVDGKILGFIIISARYGVSVKRNTASFALINYCLDSDFDSGILSNVKVVGNIIDNSELLKK